MATGTSAKTELEAINAMLGAIFEAPVTTLDVPGIMDVAIAQRLLSDQTREILLKGLAENSERDVLLLPDAVTKQVPLPQNTLRVKAEKYDGRDVVQRGQLLYDRSNHTLIFQSGVYVSIIYHLEWDDLPEHVKHPIMVLAARRFQATILGDVSKGAFDEKAETDARALLFEADDDIESPNMTTDSWSVYSILQR